MKTLMNVPPTMEDVTWRQPTAQTLLAPLHAFAKMFILFSTPPYLTKSFVKVF